MSSTRAKFMVHEHAHHITPPPPSDLGHDSHESVREMYPSSGAGSSGIGGGGKRGLSRRKGCIGT